MIEVVRTFAVGLLLALAFGGAHADPPTISYLPNGGQIIGGAITGSDQPWRSLTGGGAIPPGAVVVGDGVSARVGSNNVPMVLKRTIPWNRVGDLAARTLPVIAVGVALWDIWDNLRVKPGGGGLVADAGVPKLSEERYEYGGVNGIWSVNPEGACYALNYGAGKTIRTVTGTTSPYALRCRVVADDNWNRGTLLAEDLIGRRSTTAVFCPAWVDFSNPALSGPAGSAPGLDGLCRTGRYDPISAQAAADLFEQHAPKTDAPSYVQDALRGGVDVGPYVGDAPGVASGPSTVSGTPTSTTTTGPTGAPITTTSTPTKNISYTNNQYTYNTTVVTVTNDNGQVTTTTTTGGESAPESKTDCDKYPDSIGCSKYGQPSTEAPIWATKTVVYSEDALGLPSGCPPDRHFNFRGIDLQLRYQVLCDVAPTIKLALLALAALSCMFIVVQALKQ